MPSVSEMTRESTDARRTLRASLEIEAESNVADQNHDLVIIGAGPGGYVAAVRAAQLGTNVACVLKESAFGGTCLRVGCIPSKALLESSELFAQAKLSFAAHGIKLGKVGLDLAAMLKRKDKVVAALTNPGRDAQGSRARRGPTGDSYLSGSTMLCATIASNSYSSPHRRTRGFVGERFGVAAPL